MTYDVIIVGAGPGGLSCAEVTARRGLKTLVLERKTVLGRKVCAGGITWNGLIQKMSGDIFDRLFPEQQVYTQLQKVCVSASSPIIATVNREKLGQKMAQKAALAGAEIRTGSLVVSIGDRSLVYEDKATGKRDQIQFGWLVGADGSSSLVRRHIGISTRYTGVGINYQIPGDYDEMQWHLNSFLFDSGYAWVFPHLGSASIGAYVDGQKMKAHTLNKNLIKWGEQHGHPLRKFKPSAELINFDFRGWCFNNIFLVGDAAGLASGLTGEGIFPAIVSGETVGNYIADPHHNISPLVNLIRNNSIHRKLVKVGGIHRSLAMAFAEIAVFALKIKLLNFSKLEMAH